MARSPDAFFLPVEGEGEDGGQRFCLYHAPQGAVRGMVLYVHPFAEEMNKSRRMAAMQSRALAEAGFGVLQIDLLGCGDSSGDFGDATWEAWVQDVLRGCTWLHARDPAAPLWLWGLRAGALLVAEAARRLDGIPCNLLFWSPVSSGKTHLQQFLRLKAAAEMLSGGGKGVTEELRRQLTAGQTVEVAGYQVSPGLAGGMDAATLAPPGAKTGAAQACVHWLEMSPQEGAPLAPASERPLQAWQATGRPTHGRTVQGPAFWQTTEIEDAPQLIAATLAALAPLPEPVVA